MAGPPETLALLLWGRVRSGAAGLEVTGDRDGLDADRIERRQALIAAADIVVKVHPPAAAELPGATFA